MNLWPVEHLFQQICHHFWVGLLGAIANPPKSDDKHVEKSVQLVRGSSFRNDLLQNPYFSSHARCVNLCCYIGDHSFDHWWSRGLITKLYLLKTHCEKNPKNILPLWVRCLCLKYGFCNKSSRKDNPRPVEHLFQQICHHFWMGLLGAIANPPKKWWQVC